MLATALGVAAIHHEKRVRFYNAVDLVNLLELEKQQDKTGTVDGNKEILGIYLSDNESASYWLSVLTELQNRGLEDILIASIDGLSGFPEAIASIFPKTEIQLCIIHQIRNTMKYVASKNQKAFMKDLY